MSWSMCIESDATSSRVTYGAWQTKTTSMYCYGSKSCSSTSAGTSTFTFNVSGSTHATGFVVGHTYQVGSTFSGSSWSNHQHENNVYLGTVSVSEGGSLTKVSSTSVFTYNGNNAPSISVSFPVTVKGTSVNVGSSSNPVYSLSAVINCSYTYSCSYQIREVFNYSLSDKVDTMNDNVVEGVNTSKGILSKITDFFGSFFQNLINSVISLFVPSADEMSGLFDQLNQFFSDRFGFLYAPFDYMIQLLGVFTSSSGATGLTLPGFSIMGYEVWPDLTYDLASDDLVGEIFGYVRIGTGCLLAGYFIMFLQDFFKERFGSG